jgi:DNA-binding IclR family transcriptional regulator
VVKPALAAGRAVRVIDFLSVHPGQPFSLKEIARAIGVSGASTLSVLAALTEAGYLVRHPTHKTYTLGAALVAAGQAALVRHPAVGAAREELALLANELEVQCLASVLIGDELVVVVTEGRARRPAAWARVGARVPFSAPIGAPFAAWGDDALRARWIRHGRASLVADDRSARLEHALAEMRERGYDVGRESETREHLWRALWALVDDPVNPEVRAEVDRVLDEMSDGFVVVNLDPREVIDVSNVTVPVFSPTGEVIMMLTSTGFPAPLAGTAVTEVGARLRASADVITRRAFGETARQRPPARDSDLQAGARR